MSEDKYDFNECPYCHDTVINNKKLIKSSPGGFVQDFNCKKCKGEFNVKFGVFDAYSSKGYAV